MKKYDFVSAKRFIQMYADQINTVGMGIQEDWFWTAQDVYSDAKFSVDLSKEGLEIGGISGSSWGTPCMNIFYKDGREEFKDCYVGDSSEQKPYWFSLGCMSQPCQDRIDDKITPKLCSTLTDKG